MTDNPTGKQYAIPIEWHIPDNIEPRYATNMVVQNLEHEFIISFFDMQPPVLIGGPEKIERVLQETTSIRARCLAQIIVARDRMPGFIKAFQDAAKISPVRNEPEEQE